MSTTFDLGRIGLCFREDYSASTSYEKLDVVTYNGSSYVAKADTTGNLPTDTTYWSLMAKGSEPSPRSQAIILPNGSCISYGSVGIVPTANAVTRNYFRFPHEFKARPTVVVSPETGVINTTVKGSSASDIQNCYAAMNVYRTNTTNTQNHYTAMGEAKSDAYAWDYQTPYAPHEELLNEMGIYVTASSVYGDYSPWKAMDGNLSSPHGFAPATADVSPLLSIQMPHQLRNMIVLLGNPAFAESTATPFVSSGTFYGSTEGSTWTQIGTFSGHSATETFVVSEFQIGNATPFNYLRIAMTKPSGATRVGLFDLRIRGTIAG